MLEAMAETERDDEQQLQHTQEAQEAAQQAEHTDAGMAAESGQQAEQGEEGDVIISFEGESTASEEVEQEQAQAPAWVKELRKSDREKARKIRELEAKLAEKAHPAAEELGKEPELDDAEIDYDTAKFKTAWAKWNDRKAAHDARQREQSAAAEQQEKAWKATLDNYGTAKAALKVEDFDEAEEAANTALGTTKAAIILSGADKPAELVYALGRNPAKLKELASIQDPVKFAFAVAKLETQMKVTPRKAPPPAEKAIRGTSTAVGVADKTLERLEAEAQRTNDYSKVFSYKREQRRKAEG
jgi:hypothetical protein